MTDLVITAANVVAGSGAITRHGLAGAAITAGQAVYLDPDTGKYLLADCDSATVAARVPDGIALNGAANNQPLVVAKKGPVTIGATLVPGTAYYLSGTPGGICPVADVASGDRVVLLGLAASASVLNLSIQDTGVTL